MHLYLSCLPIAFGNSNTDHRLEKKEAKKVMVKLEVEVVLEAVEQKEDLTVALKVVVFVAVVSWEVKEGHLDRVAKVEGDHMEAVMVAVKAAN